MDRLSDVTLNLDCAARACLCRRAMFNNIARVCDYGNAEKLQSDWSLQDLGACTNESRYVRTEKPARQVTFLITCGARLPHFLENFQSVRGKKKKKKLKNKARIELGYMNPYTRPLMTAPP